MTLTPKAVVHEISALASTRKYPVSTIAIVGSSSPVSKEISGSYSDVDLVILHENAPDSNPFLDDLHEKIGREWRVLKTWGIVSPASIGAPAVHVHSVSVDAYLECSSLFRRSVGKYPSLVGRSLASYAPRPPISRQELLHDRLGITSILERLDSSKQEFGFALAVEESQNYSSPLDVSVYCVLHSVRNTLRWLRKYEEFSAIEELQTMWSAVGGTEADTLDRFLSRKRSRRKGNLFSKEDEVLSAKEARTFLLALSEWIERYRARGRSS